MFKPFLFLPIMLLPFFAGLAQAAPAVDYAAPIEWIKVDGGHGVDAFQTSFDDAKKFIVLIRFVDTSPMSVEEWVRTEKGVMEREKGEVFTSPGPVEETWGDLNWETLEWDSPKTSEHGKQFYLEYGPSNVVEISIASKTEVFDRIGLAPFEKFLKSFKLAR